LNTKKNDRRNFVDYVKYMFLPEKEWKGSTHYQEKNLLKKGGPDGGDGGGRGGHVYLVGNKGFRDIVSFKICTT
jgi:GTP-binding protein